MNDNHQYNGINEAKQRLSNIQQMLELTERQITTFSDFQKLIVPKTYSNIKIEGKTKVQNKTIIVVNKDDEEILEILSMLD